MAKKQLSNKQVARDVIISAFQASEKSPLIALGVSMMPYRLMHLILQDKVSDGRTLDEWCLAGILELANRMEMPTFVTPLFSVQAKEARQPVVYPDIGIPQILSAMKK